MKYIKIYEDFHTDLDSLCEKYGIKNYTIKVSQLMSMVMLTSLIRS
jgi:hypothetical protein